MIVGAFLFGGVANVVQIVLVALPVYVIARAVATAVAALLGRLSRVQEGNAGHE